MTALNRVRSSTPRTREFAPANVKRPVGILGYGRVKVHNEADESRANPGYFAQIDQQLGAVAHLDLIRLGAEVIRIRTRDETPFEAEGTRPDDRR